MVPEDSRDGTAFSRSGPQNERRLTPPEDAELASSRSGARALGGGRQPVEWRRDEWCEGPWRVAFEAAGEGPASLYLHGFGLAGASLRPLAQARASAGVRERALLLDWPGHGRSGDVPDGVPASYPTLHGVLLRVLEALAPDGALVIGHSMGGQVALAAARTQPGWVRRLVVIGAGAGRAVRSEREHAAWERAAGHFESADAAARVEALHAAGPLCGAAPEWTPEVLFGEARGPQLARFVREGFLAVEDEAALGPAVGVPLTVVWGDRDEGWRAASQALLEAVPGARGGAVPGGHLVHVESPAAVAVAIEAAGHPAGRDRAGGWRRLGSDRPFACPWFGVRRDHVLLPDGERIAYHVLEQPGWVMVVPLLPGGEVLLERVHRWPLGTWQLECPSGGNDGQAPEDAARRELREETGHGAGALEPLGRYAASSGHANERFDLFLARDLRPAGPPARERTEQIELVTIPFAEACAMARRGEIADGPSALALLLAESRLA